MNRLVIVGCGKLATVVVNAMNRGLLPDYELVGVYSRSECKAENIAQMYNGVDVKICRDIDELLALKPDYMVESASPTAMRDFSEKTLRSGCSIVTLSIGALADPELYKSLQEVARQSGTRIYIASGATGGFDVIRTASLMGPTEGWFFNEKGPNALKGTPVYDESLQNEQRVVFEGNAAEAIKVFPTRVNVSVAASLASVGPENIKMKMLSTPGFKGDTQRVEVKNEQVHAVVDVYSATAEIAAWSVVNVLQNIVSPVVFF